MKCVVVPIIAFAVAAAACSGGTATRTYAEDDLLAIGATKPPLPKGQAWRGAPDGRLSPIILHDSLFSLLPNRRQPDTGGLESPGRWWLRELDGAGLRRSHVEDWQTGDPFGSTYASAESVLFLFRDANGAREAVDALIGAYEVSNDELLPLKEVSAVGLGEESGGWKVGSQSVFGSENVLFAWRRGNVVAAAFVECECDFDVIESARAYADAIDAEAATR